MMGRVARSSGARRGELDPERFAQGLDPRDVDRGRQLLVRDDALDDHYAQIFQELLKIMGRDPSTVFRATRIQSIAKYLERIADHAMNIVDSVIFLVNGTDIRHHH